MKTTEGLTVSKDLVDEISPENIKEFIFCRGNYSISYYDKDGNCIEMLPVPLKEFVRDAFCFSYSKDGRERVGFEIEDFDPQTLVDMIYEFKHPDSEVKTVLSDSFSNVKIVL